MWRISLNRTGSTSSIQKISQHIEAFQHEFYEIKHHDCNQADRLDRIVFHSVVAESLRHAVECQEFFLLFPVADSQ